MQACGAYNTPILTHERIRSDFDTIATLSPRDERLGPHEAPLLAELPGGGVALDIGCGLGTAARLLAPRYERVEGIDLSPTMIAEATRRSDAHPNVRFACADLFEWLAARRETYDCIVSLACLHHVDEERALEAIGAALRPGGTLLVVDLVDRASLVHLPMNGIAWFVSQVRQLREGYPSRAEREAWREHGRGERYLTWREVQRLAAMLPGARVRQHLLWRYSLRWVKK